MSQLKGTLLQTPLEMRHEIYSYILPSHVHVCLRGDKFCLSTCQESDTEYMGGNYFLYTYHNSDDEHECHPMCNTHSSVWARRLQSSWGPHWRCAENVEKSITLNIPLLLVCKMMSVFTTLTLVYKY
jgi:hypothetical protein